jgi:hypothetical protein
MKKIIFAGLTAVAFSIAMGAASAYEYNHTARVAVKSGACACNECTCQNCSCADCSNGNCNNGCCTNSSGCCSKK